MLALEGVEIERGAFTLAADWSVPQGARVAVMGPSGGGKSTLLDALAGFAPHAGRILWQGARIDALAPAARPLTILFQDHNLLPNLTLAQNVALGIDDRLRPPALARARAALEEVGLEGLHDRRPGQVSGGQAGRAGLARALVRARPLLLLDEPFAALGPGMKADLRDLVARVCARHGLTLVMVTHDPLDARALCPLTVVVDNGIAAPPAPTGALLAVPPPGLAAYLGVGAAPRASADRSPGRGETA